MTLLQRQELCSSPISCHWEKKVRFSKQTVLQANKALPSLLKKYTAEVCYTGCFEHPLYKEEASTLQQYAKAV